nr:cation:proton antiporter [Halopiger aswanensis]
MLVFLTAPLVLQRYRLPGIVGIIVVGAAIGPNGAGLLERDETIVLLGEVGIVYLMFVAGLEINLSQFIAYRDRSVVFGVLSFVVPQAIGTVVGVAALDLSFGAASLFAAIFSSHTLLAYPIVSRLGIATVESVTATIGGTIVTDTLALLVLAVVVAAERGAIGPLFWLELTGKLAVFFAGVWLLVPRLGRWFFRTVEQESYFEFLFVMVVLFAAASLAAAAGVEGIVGAFLAGLALNRLVPESGPLMNRIEFVGNALFIPFFLLSVGMLVDVRVLTAGLETVTIAVAFLVLVTTTKYAAAWLTAERYGYTRDETMVMFGLSVGQAAAALAIVLIGFEVGLLDEAMVNAVVVMILVVSVFSPAVVDRYGRALVRAADRAAYDPATAPQRLMLAFPSRTDPSTNRQRLVDLGVAIREPEAAQPLYVATVARPDPDGPEPERNTDAEIAEIEASFAETEAYTAGAEVPIELETRIDDDVAAGIGRAALENRITTLIVGWDGSPSRWRTFGTVIDRLLERTSQQVLVARLSQPLNTTDEIVAVLPPGIDRNEGFYGTVRTLADLADGIGASLRGLAVDRRPDRYERLFELVDPDVPATVDGVDGWPGARDRLRAVGETDLAVLVSARRGATGWHPELETLPADLARTTAGNVIVVSPSGDGRGDDRQFFRFD